jgi:hypothetical protein
VFSEKSFEEVERLHDEFTARKIKEYFEAHPEEQNALINSSNKKIEAAEKSE